MKQVTGWWFAPKDNRLANGDRRKIAVGKTHKVEGQIIPCKWGLHLSKRPIDALEYAPGPIIYKVKGYGIIISNGSPIDKYACSRRKYLAGGFDAANLLREFARLCALDVIHLWDAPNVVVQYLQTGDKTLRAAARTAARTATWAVVAWGSAWGAAWDAAWDARTATWEAARAAARDAAMAAAGDAAMAAAGDAAGDARTSAWEAMVSKQNKRLKKMIVDEIKKLSITTTGQKGGANI